MSSSTAAETAGGKRAPAARKRGGGGSGGGAASPANWTSRLLALASAVAVAAAFAWDAPPPRRPAYVPQLRMYNRSDARVFNHYRDMRLHQTTAYYERMARKFDFTLANMTMREAFRELEKCASACRGRSRRD